MPPDVTLQRFNGSTRSQAALCQLNRGGDNDGDDGGSKFDARYTRSIGCHRNNTNTAGNKSSTAADSTRKDNNYSALDKRNYSNYYEACLPLLKPGGLIVGDNVLWSGKVVDPKDADAHGIVAFDRLVQSDSRVENVCLTVRDGMMLAWKRG